jgi:hypothetical protein
MRLHTAAALLENIYLRDLAEIVLTTRDTREAKERVWRYLERLPSSCPTDGCAHRPSELIFRCRAYGTTQSYLAQAGDALGVKPEIGFPFVIDAFCRSQGTGGRCGECKERNYGYRQSAITTSIYCHGCGFFVDFPTRRVGYSEDFLFPPFADEFRHFRTCY